APRSPLQDQIGQPRRRQNGIDIAEDTVGAGLPYRRRHQDVAALTFNLDAAWQRALAAADRLRCVPREEQMRAAGGGGMLARDDRIVRARELVPRTHAVGVVFRRIDVEAPDAALLAHRQGNQRGRMILPPLADFLRIAGRFVVAAGAWNAVGILSGR